MPTSKHRKIDESSDAPHGRAWCYTQGCRCRPCTDAALEYNARWRAKNAEKVKAGVKKKYWQNKERPIRDRRNQWLRWRYGITHDQMDAMVEAQKGLCPICELELPDGRDRHVDHDHATGLIRGVLCTMCNRGLGSFRDKPERFIRAAAYLNDNAAIVPFKKISTRR